MSVAEEAQRLVKLNDRFRQLRAMRQAKIQMIATWTEEIHDIDDEVRVLIDQYGSDIGLHGYPDWLKELIVVSERQRQAN